MSSNEGGTRVLEEQVARLARDRHERVLGIYRGVVVTVGTKTSGKVERLGQLQIRVPDVWGDRKDDLPWASPASAFAGAEYGLLMLPKAGDGVWVMFEAGNSDLPVWLGGWWSEESKLPPSSGENVRVLVTPHGHKIVLDDDKDEIRLEHAKGSKVVVGENEIRLEVKDGGKIVVDKSSVKINGNALEVEK